MISEYKINGVFTQPYEYELNLENKGKSNEVTVPFRANERGIVEAVKLTFIGTGKIILQAIDYTVGETGLPFYKSYANVYNGVHSDWLAGGQYIYDENRQTTLLSKNKLASMISLSMYIGYLRNEGHLTIPHTTYSVPVTATTKLKIVYQNKTTVNSLLVHVGFSRSEVGSSESANGPDFPVLGDNVDWEIDTEMKEYEWSTLTIEVPTEYVGTYLAKVRIGFTGNELAIRAISIEN